MLCLPLQPSNQEAEFGEHEWVKPMINTND